MSTLLKSEALPAVFQISSDPQVEAFPPFTEKSDRKGVYLWQVGYVVSPAVTQGERLKFSGAQISPAATETEVAQMHLDDRVDKYRDGRGRHDVGLIRMVIRSVPFLLFLVIASFTSGVASWSVQEKIGIVILIPLLIGWSVYAWWPRQR